MASTAFYNLPSGTTTVAPPFSTMLGYNSLCVTAYYGDTDTTLTVTHNWNLNVTAYTTLFQPWFDWVPQATAAVTVSLAVVSYAANSITVNKNTLTGSGGLFTFLLERPFSELQ